MKPVVFISHSARDAAKQVTDPARQSRRAIELQQALWATGRFDTAFDVVNLRQGVDYRPQLFRWMARCQGAVLLITPQVMADPYWVLQEATLLRARSLLEGPAFRLFMLIDAGVYQHDIWKSAFAPLKLDALQRTKLANPGDPIGGFVGAVADGMAEVEPFGGDHQGRLAELIFDRLAPFLAEKAAAELLAEWLQVDDALWQGIVPAEHALRTLYARRLAAGDLGALGGLNALFSRLQDKAQAQDRASLLNVLQSHWVPLANAGRLAEAFAALRAPATPDERPRNIVLLLTEFSAAERVAELHRERRFKPFGELGKWVSVELGNEAASAFEAKVHGALQKEHFKLEPDITLDEIVGDLAEDLAAGQHFFVHVAGVESLQHVLPAARRLWPCLFVLTARAATCARLAAELDALPIAPAHEAEVQRMRDVGKAMGYVGATG